MGVFDLVYPHGEIIGVLLLPTAAVGLTLGELGAQHAHGFVITHGRAARGLREVIARFGQIQKRRFQPAKLLMKPQIA